ncbi:MAG: lipoate--protein ligase [Planctomycetia bacterium]|nr:lipoate--protein ligase [Planctomycetia bacterium]
MTVSGQQRASQNDSTPAINSCASRAATGGCRIIVDPVPADGAWNMAVDAVLLESAVEGGTCTVRWYQWNCATLSLGYFQSPDVALRNDRLAGLPIVRRLSGGGAIVHHHELTYSCAVPAEHPLAREPRSLYAAVHERIIGELARLGLPAALRGAAPQANSAEFLCFGRNDDFDVVLANHKVLGSAQRRRKGAVLQHGSLILSRSEYAAEFPGLSELAGREISADRLLGTLPEAMAGLFAPAVCRESLMPAEQQRSESLVCRASVVHG